MGLKKLLFSFVVMVCQTKFGPHWSWQALTPNLIPPLLVRSLLSSKAWKRDDEHWQPDYHRSFAYSRKCLIWVNNYWQKDELFVVTPPQLNHVRSKEIIVARVSPVYWSTYCKIDEQLGWDGQIGYNTMTDRVCRSVTTSRVPENLAFPRKDPPLQ